MCFLLNEHLHPHHPSSGFLDVFVQSGSPQNTSKQNKQNQNRNRVYNAAIYHLKGSMSSMKSAKGGKKTQFAESEPLAHRLSNLAVVKVATQGDVTDQLGTVHQICEEPDERRSRTVKT